MNNSVGSNCVEDVSVSILITYYNQKDCIIKSLGSALQQKLNAPIEILCIDDGSDDGTFEELKEWEKAYPNVIKVFQAGRDSAVKYEPIVRVSDNRIFLYKRAKGKYVSFLDGDDYYSDKYKIQKQLDLLERYSQCSCCGSAFDYVWLDKHERKTVGMLNDRPLIIDSRSYWATTWLHADTFLYRNYYLEQNFANGIFDDNLITCYFIKKGNILFIPESTVDYVQTNGSSWNSRSSLEQSLVNVTAYVLAKKGLNKWKFENWLRHYKDLKFFFKSRKKIMNITDAFTFIKEDTFLSRTIMYNSSPNSGKLFYLFKYGFIYNLDLFVRLLKKCYKLGFKRLKNE